MKTRVILNLIVLVSMFQAFSQDKKLLRAESNYEAFAFAKAIDIYQKVADNGYESEELFKKLGDSYYFNGDLNTAYKWYSKLFQLDDTTPEAEYLFRYSHTLKAMEMYVDADNIMDLFQQISGSDKRGELFLKNPGYLEEIKSESGKYEIQPVEFNSSESDFAPSFYNDKLIFASARDTGSVSKVIHNWNNKFFLDLYEVNPENEITTKFSKRLNSKLHESTTCFTTDGKTVYFTRNNYNRGKKRKDEEGVIRLKIYKADIDEKGAWINVKELPFNSDVFSVAHPTLNADETKLYFASDMPGGYGLSDLYEVDIRIDGVLSEPKNLGPEINTEGRETFPFLSKNGELYFASDGRPGLGGLDVYSVDLSGYIHEINVTNLGKPINSNADDFSFIINDETNKGYFASNRKGGKGSDDIYALIRQAKCNNIRGVAFDFHSNEPISIAKVELVNEDNQVIDSTRTDIKGTYVFNRFDCDKKYLVRASKENYFTNEIPVDLNEEFTNISLEKNLVTAQEGDDLGKILHLNPIYFDFGKAYIRKDAKIELEKIIVAMKKYPNLKIDVRSHTDSRAGDKFNMLLSDRRAKSTVQYIIAQGIDKSRIRGKGYGESQLINNCSNGVDCSEEAHQLNRRSEFIIIKN